MLTANVLSIVIPTLGIPPVPATLAPTIMVGQVAQGGAGMLGQGQGLQSALPTPGLAIVAYYDPYPVGSILIGGTTGTAYSTTIIAQGGSGGGYSFAVTSGTLPPGTSLNPSTGVISGTPTTLGAYSFTITITDGAGSTGSQAFTIAIDAPSSGGGQNFGMTN